VAIAFEQKALLYTKMKKKLSMSHYKGCQLGAEPRAHVSFVELS
jgi:hypothetical protein